MAGWNIKKLQQYIESTNPNDTQAIQIITSIGRCIEITLFHIFEARDAMNRFENAITGDEKEQLIHIFGFGEHQTEFQFSKLALQANLNAAINSARNLYDIFSQLINILVLNREIEEHLCDIYKVKKQLPSSPLKNDITALIGSHWFGYVAAFTNISKHRMLITQSYTVDFLEKKAEVKTANFSYKTSNYSSYWSGEVLEGILEVKNSIIHCGNSLNDMVIHDCA